MATKFWTGGAGDNNFSTAGNWSDSAQPTTGDVCILAANPASGVDNIQGGDFRSLGNISLVVGPNWSGTVGKSNVALRLSLTSLEYAGQSSVANIQGSDTVTMTDCIITDTGAGSMPLRIGGDVNITNLTVTGGKGVIQIAAFTGGTPTVTNVSVIGTQRGTVVDMAYNGVISGTTARVNGGTLRINGNYTNVEVSGTGTLEVLDTPTITNLDMYGGTTSWLTSGTTSAISGRLGVYSGVFDASQCTAVTSTISGTELYDTGTINEQNGVESIVWSGGITVNGGSLQLDPGRLVTVS